MLEKATLSRDEPIDNLLNAKALPHPVSIILGIWMATT